MSYPVQDIAHVSEGVAWLIEQFKNSSNVKGLLSSYLRPIQDLENVYWDIINKYLLGTAVGDQLANLGALVGEPRNGRNDTDYRAAVTLRIRVNRSQGLAEDIIQVANLASGNLATYQEYYPMAFEVFVYNTLIGNVLAKMLYSTKSVSVAGRLVTTTWSVVNAFQWDAASHPRGTPYDFDSVYTSNTTHKFCNVQDLSPAGLSY